MSSSSISDINKTVRRNSDDFSYVKTIGNLINNREFSRGYNDFVNGNKTEKTYIWEVLSAIGDDVGQTIYENVLNYIDNISNVDLCKIKPLRSMLSSFGIQYSILNNIDLVPLDVLNIIDVLSINKKYLLNQNILDSKLIDKIIESGSYIEGQELSDLPPGLSGVSSIVGYIDEDKYNGFLSSIYYDIIDNNINTKYGTYQKYPIYATYGKNLVQEEYVESDINNDSAYQLKIRSNVDTSFNESDIVNNINAGTDDIENYSGVYKTLIEMEMQKREKPYSPDYNDTRYAYYKEKNVKEYFTFLKNKFNNINEDYKNEVYQIDDNYFQINQDSNLCLLILDYEDGLYHLTKDDMVPPGMVSYESVMRRVVRELVDITIYISKLREELKLQLQKTHMKGTFNLLSYIINEYLLEFAKSNKIMRNNKDVINTIRNRVKTDTKIIEYYDTTEYYNISTDVSKNAYNGKYVNDRYWEETEDKVNSNSGFAFAKNEIENFYNNILNVKNKTSDLMDFLSTIYSSGANRSYVDDKSRTLVISTNSKLSSESTEMFQRFSGINSVGTEPYMNHKNKTHSSYQVHPYLFNFIEAANYNYPVINSFYNDINEELEDQYVLENLSNTIGQYGQVINVALENQYDFSGYKTRYESSPHQAATRTKIGKYAIIDYDGAFYPPATKDFIENPQFFISCLQNKIGYIYENYYEHLNLNQYEINHICKQLSTYKDEIIDKIEEKKNLGDVWDIYKYGRDAYDNMYILYKNYHNENVDFKTKQNTRGQLWIRFKDNPIAFPAIHGKNPQIDTRLEYYNNLFDNIINGKILETEDDCMYFYDMEFDSTKQFLFISYYPIHTLNKKIPTLSSNPQLYDTRQNSSIIACKITKQYDKEVGYNRLQLNSDRTNKIDGYENSNMMHIIEEDDHISGVEGTAFLGFFKNGNSTGLAYVNKILSSDDYGNPLYLIPDDRQLYSSFAIFNKMNQIKEYSNVKIDVGSKLVKFTNADIHFGYHEDQLTFVFPVVIPDVENYQNYLGKSAKSYDPHLSSYGNVNYNEDSKGDTIYDDTKTEMNSFDALNECIGVIDTYLDGGKLNPIQPIKIYNLNGDPSYIPSFPGDRGKTDISKSSTYKTKYNIDQHLQFEILGKSKNIDKAIKNAVPNADTCSSDSIEETKRKLMEKLYGRIFEDYKYSDKSLRIKTNDTLYSNPDEEEIVWDCDILESDTITQERYLSSLELFIYNTQTSGKNPYYTGKLSAITGEEYVDLEYMMNYGDTSEVSVDGCDNIYVAGTYDFFSGKYNKSDYNTILGIDGIKARFYNGILQIKFHKIDTIRMFVPYRTVDCVVINREDIRTFEKYHYLDQFACIEGEISGDVDNRRFNDLFLSSVYLSNYNSLDEVPFLSGQNSLSFKYCESPIFEKGSMMYYYPGFNAEFPKKLGDVYSGTIASTQENKDLFTQDSLFIIKCEDDNVLTSFGNTKIPIIYNDTSSIRIIEDYLSGDFQPEFDTVDARILQYVKLDETEEADWEEIHDYEPKKTTNPQDFSDETDRLFQTCKIAPMKVEESQSDYISERIPFDPSGLQKQLDKLSKFLNIYINYKKNPDRTLTLYFNYINYLNTPFLKIVDSSMKIDTIEKTYLKLEPGQDGYLDIMIQLKYYYDDKKIYGYKNIKLITYHIWNISDDKPKFLLHKHSSV